MFQGIKDFFSKAWKWIEAVWDRHDDMLGEMVSAILPMVIDVALRPDLTGEEKKKVIKDAILDNADEAAAVISSSILNEAIEVAANRYNIQMGTLTVGRMDAALQASLKAGRDYANNKLDISGTEAEDAGVVLDKPSEPDVVALSNADVVTVGTADGT